MELHAQIACAMPRELARKGVGWKDRAVYTEAIYHGRENLTDGIIARSSLAFWMPDMPIKERSRRLDAIRDTGALLDHPEGWAFPDHVWRKWGKTRAEVNEKRADEAERLRKHREKMRAAREDVRDSYDERTDVRDECVRDTYETPEPKPQPEPEPKPEPYPDPSCEKSSSSLTLIRTRTDDDDEQRFTRTIDIIVAAKEAEYRPNRPTGWRITVAADERQKNGRTIRNRLTAGDDPIDIAASIVGSQTGAEVAAAHLDRNSA